jgi:hypothetical protein
VLFGCGQDFVAPGSGEIATSLDQPTSERPGALDEPEGQPASRFVAAPPALDPSDPYPQRLVLHGDTSAAGNLRSDRECAAQGPDWIYELDLRAFHEPVTANIGLRATFDGSLRLEQGRWEDPFLVACNEDQAPGANEAFLGLTLEPALYRLIVDGETPSDAGGFELVLELAKKAANCAVPPPNDRCSDAVPIDPRSKVQTFFGSTRCASDQVDPLWECGNFSDRDGDVFYSLDLSGFDAPVRLHASTDLAPTNFPNSIFVTRDVNGSCSPAFACGASPTGATQLWAKLDPGRYFLGVEGSDGATGEFGLAVEFDSAACVVSNDTCQTAQLIQPRLGTQTFTAWPMCGDDSISTRCALGSPNPDIFYQLDLRQFSQPVHVRASAQLGADSFSSLLLLSDAGGSCGAELWCGDLDLWLPPESYYLGLDGFRDQQGPVLVSLSLDVQGAAAPAECIDSRVASCAQSVDCCAGDGPECWLVLMSCGLRREALDCLCESEPHCCGTGYDFDAVCGDWLEECGTFCAGFDPVLACKT